MPPRRSIVVVNLKACARCGGDHPRIRFERLTYPVRPDDHPLTHWAPCPDTGEPILLRVV